MENNDLEKILENNTGGINEQASVVEEIVSQETVPVAQESNDTNQKKGQKSHTGEKRQSTFIEKIMTSFACAVVFALVAFVTFKCSANLWGPIGTINTSNKNPVNVELGAAEIIEAPDGDLLSTSVSEVAKSAMPAIVSITNLSVQEVDLFFYGKQQYESESTGSGIIIGKNDKELLIITNNHVIEGNKTLTITFCNETSVEAVVKGSDANIDIAVVAVKLEKVPEDTLKAIKVAPLGNSKNLVVGEPTVAIGNALGYGQSVTSGIVSALDRKIDGFDTALIQTDAAINPGNSGGALLNIKGEVIGINTAKMSADAVEGMGYAIPISEISEVMKEMMNKVTREKVPENEKGRLGVACVDVNDVAVEFYNMPRGAYINEVEKDGAAYKAGITKGSIITRFDGTAIASSTSMVDLLAYYKAGETVTLEIAVPKSDGTYESKEIQVTLSATK